MISIIIILAKKVLKYTSKSLSLSTICLMLIFLIGACNTRQNESIPDISDVKIDFKVIRFEKELFEIDSSKPLIGLKGLQIKYPKFYQTFTKDILGLGNAYPDSMYSVNDTLSRYFLLDSQMRALNDTISLLLPNLDKQFSSIETSLRFLKFYLPEEPTPDIYTYIAPFIYQTVLTDSLIGIELDMYLGRDFPVYSGQPFNYPQYISRRFDIEFMPSNVAKTIADDIVPSDFPKNTLLNHMIREGKVLFLAKKLLPNTPDSLLTGFTGQQQAWCEFNEKDIWAFWVSEDLLYSKKISDIQKCIGEAPNTQGMPSEAPGKTAVWTGYKIINEFMRRNPNTSIRELLAEKDGMKLLTASKYDPKEKDF